MAVVVLWAAMILIGLALPVQSTLETALRARHGGSGRHKHSPVVLEGVVPANFDGVTGSIVFQPSCLKGYNMITINMFGLQMRAYYWDIHTVVGKLNPLDYCSNAGPFFVGPRNRQDGALSTRLGNWGSENNIVNRIYLDNSTDLTGKYSIQNQLLLYG